MSISIHKRSVREGLKPRREPYWGAPIEAGRFLGFRKIAGKPGSWIARARDKDTGKQNYRALDTSADNFEAARAEARRWFEELDAGVDSGKGAFTVADACREYVDTLRRTERFAAADDAGWRFKRGEILPNADESKTAVNETDGPLEKLRVTTIEQWRSLLG